MRSELQTRRSTFVHVCSTRKQHATQARQRAYRFAYGASDDNQAGGAYTSAIVKVDVETGVSTSFSDDTYIFGEPLFVSRPEGDSEDDGVLLTVGSAQNAESSVLASSTPGR
jgi:beta,beta-carotene 9',10'-dioxygenase